MVVRVCVCVCVCVCVVVYMRVCIKKETGGPPRTHAHDDAQPQPLLGVPVAGDEARRGQAVHLCVTADGCDMPTICISLYIYIYIHRYRYRYRYGYGYGYGYRYDIDMDMDIDIDTHMPSTFE